jgi:hypothetical protein
VHAHNLSKDLDGTADPIPCTASIIPDCPNINWIKLGEA